MWLIYCRNIMIGWSRFMASRLMGFDVLTAHVDGITPQPSRSHTAPIPPCNGDVLSSVRSEGLV